MNWRQCTLGRGGDTSALPQAVQGRAIRFAVELLRSNASRWGASSSILYAAGDSLATGIPLGICRTAPSNLSDATTLSATVLPFVDGITATAPIDPPPPATAPIFTFSATQDPGEGLGLRV